MTANYQCVNKHSYGSQHALDGSFIYVGRMLGCIMMIIITIIIIIIIVHRDINNSALSGRNGKTNIQKGDE